MKTLDRNARLRSIAALSLLMQFSVVHVRAAGVTIITHGLWSDVTSWIFPMAGAMIGNGTYFGTSATCYEMKLVQNASGNYVFNERLVSGDSPLVSDSAEIFVKLDWSALSNLGIISDGSSTSEIARIAVQRILDPEFFPEMQGRSLAELPIHLIGHSRGASVATEMARLFGQRGLWIDQVTTLDPHPLNNDGFDFFSSGGSPIVDGSVTAWENILFFDNYWQQNSSLFTPNGESVRFAFNRYVGPLGGGYNDAHKNIHLWYHGTIDTSPFATDSQASVGTYERSFWWASSEQQGAKAGFLYSLIGRGDRTSTVEPAGPGTGKIRDGLNQLVDFGAGLAGNRYALLTNTREWPNLPLVSLTGSNYGTSTTGIRIYPQIPNSPFSTNSFRLFAQRAAGPLASASVSYFLDQDSNPYNGVAIRLGGFSFSDPSTNRPRAVNLGVDLGLTSVSPGLYTFMAAIQDNGHTRYIYAPELIAVFPPLRVQAVKQPSAQARISVSGVASASVILQRSSDLSTWTTFSTNSLTSSPTNAFVGTFSFIDNSATQASHQFYRAAYP